MCIPVRSLDAIFLPANYVLNSPSLPHDNQKYFGIILREIRCHGIQQIKGHHTLSEVSLACLVVKTCGQH